MGLRCINALEVVLTPTRATGRGDRLAAKGMLPIVPGVRSSLAPSRHADLGLPLSPRGEGPGGEDLHQKGH
jgi:hypothetical protein